MADGSKKHESLKTGLITAGGIALLVVGIGTCEYLSTRPHRVGERDGCEVSSQTFYVKQGPDVEWEYNILTEQCPGKTTKFWINPYTDECYDVEVRDASGKVLVDKSADMTEPYQRACAELNAWVEARQKR